MVEMLLTPKVEDIKEIKERARRFFEFFLNPG